MQVTLVSGAIHAAGTGKTDGYHVGRNARYLAAQVDLVRTSGGTSINIYIQTSLDNGETWADVMNFSLATTTARKVSAVVVTTALAAAVTPTDGTLTANTILSGLIGSKIRVKTVVVGTYVGTLNVSVVVR
jgi:vancomycin resistance protein YoaR